MMCLGVSTLSWGSMDLLRDPRPGSHVIRSVFQREP